MSTTKFWRRGSRSSRATSAARRTTIATVLLALLVVPGVRPAQAQPRTWEQEAPNEQPSPRFGHGTAFDSARGEVVVFGGRHANFRKDMWTWDGITWSKVSLPGNVSKPDGRSDMGMTYDAANGEVVLFGGETRSGIVGDTWTWNGSAWTQETPGAAPNARSAPSLVYDAANGEAVLFGGRAADGSALGDTWTWDGTTWNQETPSTTPASRHDAAMVYDAANGEVVLFGGRAADGSALGDTWTWDGTTWNQETPSNSPPSRSSASIAHDAAHGDVVLFGGTDVLSNNELWSWDGANWSEVNTPNRPSARSESGMVYDAANGEAVLFGGRDAKGLDDTWTLIELEPVEGPNVGGGIVSGAVAFDGSGVPQLGEACEPTSFDLEAQAEAVVGNLAPTAYVGPVNVTGTGGSPCENAGAGAGSLDLTASGDGPSGTSIDCGPLRGQYNRVAADVTAVLSGPCIVNEFATGNITFTAKVEFHPTQGDGITTRITEAAFDGVFTVVPN